MTEPHPHRFPGVTFAAIAAELERENAQRRQTFGRMVDKGTMSPAEAEWQIDVFAAMIDDCARFARAWAASPVDLAAIAEPSHRFAWTDRRAALLREIDYRARLYPQWIAKGNMTRADADRRIQLLEALLHTFEEGIDWRPSNGLPPPYWGKAGDDWKQARIECHRMLFTVATRRQDRAWADGLIRMIAHDAPAIAEELRDAQPRQQEALAL